MAILLKGSGGSGNFIEVDKLPRRVVTSVIYMRSATAMFRSTTNYDYYLDLPSQFKNIVREYQVGSGVWQTIIDESAGCILASITSPRVNTATVMDIEVTIDGDMKLFTFNLAQNEIATIGSSSGGDYGIGTTKGFSSSGNFLLGRADELIRNGAPTTRCEESIKVRIRSSSAPNPSNHYKSCEVSRQPLNP